METKKCTKCKKLLPLGCFRKDRSKKDGLYSSCNECYRERLGFKKRIRPKGTIFIDSQGYQRKTGIEGRLHRYIMEKYLGYKLRKDQHVHHINGIKTDNRIENLQVISASDHHKHHYKEKMDKIFREHIKNLNLTVKCEVCGSIFNTKSYRAKYCSAKCMRTTRVEYRKKWEKHRKDKLDNLTKIDRTIREWRK